MYRQKHNQKTNDLYGIPQSFYEVIKPYIEGESRKVAETRSELLTIWRAAISAYDESPDLAEVAAEWAMSTGASSPLINEPQYKDIHVRFGQAEAPSDDKDEQWATIRQLVNELAEDTSAHE